MKRVGLTFTVISLIVGQIVSTVPASATELISQPDEVEPAKELLVAETDAQAPNPATELSPEQAADQRQPIVSPLDVVPLGIEPAQLVIDDVDADVAVETIDATAELDQDIAKHSEVIDQANQSTQTDDESGGIDTAPEADELLIIKVQVGLTDATDAEFIEIYNPSSTPVTLNDWSLEYLNASYDETDNQDGLKRLVTINDKQVGPQSSLVIANLDYSEQLEHFDYTYGEGANTLYHSGTVRLLHNSEVIDMVGWGSASQFEGQAAAVEKRGSIERCMDGQQSIVVDTDNNYLDFAVYDWPHQQPALGLIAVCSGADESSEGEDGQSEMPINPCQGLRLSEIATNVDRQFIEVYNYSDDVVDLMGCKIESERDNGSAVFGGIEVIAGDYEVIYLDDDQTLDLYKTTHDTVYLLPSNGTGESDALDVQKYQDLDKDTSLSFIDGQWEQTYKITPGEPNQLERYLPCDPGKERNPLTGRCIGINGQVSDDLVPCAAHQFRNLETNRCNNKVSVASAELKPCRSDQFRNPATNRCKLKTSQASALVPCKPNQERNPATNRCRKVGSDASQLKPCQDGYERNPATNRCRKDRSSLGEVAGYAVEPIADSAQSTIGWWAFGGVALLAAGYGTWEWRSEIARLIRGVIHLGRH